tara:strand:- start:2652 stop:2813 length:162 start_codon:yes stop_codon:yes gene_type:complete
MEHIFETDENPKKKQKIEEIEDTYTTIQELRKIVKGMSETIKAMSDTLELYLD